MLIFILCTEERNFIHRRP